MRFKTKLLLFAISSFVILLFVFGFYFYKFALLGLSNNQELWGQFGDFVGGTLNPILAFLSFMALLYTIKIQTDELKLSREELEATREELKGSRIAQQEQSESLKLQNEATKLQMFENTFFQVINLFIQNRAEIIYGTNNSIKPLSKILRNLKIEEGKTTETIYDEFYEKFEAYTGTYFGQTYQVIKFIDNSNIGNKQRYINIFRAQFSKDELVFLFYHCLGTIGKRKLKKLVEGYEFFEHLILNEDIEKQLLVYDIKAFGKNEIILKRYIELKEKAKTEEIPAFVKAE